MENLSLKDTAQAWIESATKKDNDFKSFYSLFGLNTTSSVTVSGLTNQDYPRQPSCVGGSVSINKVLPLPYELIEKFSSMRDACLMGTFVSCQRVWITIDNEFFMWDFETGDDLACYDQLNDTIISVGIAAPSPDLFPDKVKHLLILSTLTEIVVLGMTLSQSNDDNQVHHLLDLIPHPLYRISNDLLAISTIKSLPNGRIFMGTRDGSLLEFTYQSIPDWGPTSLRDLPPSAAYKDETVGLGQCTIINHSQSSLSFMLPKVIRSGFSQPEAIVEIVVDPLRGYLYTRTECSALITSYQYSASMPGLVKVATVNGSSLCDRAYSAVHSVSKNEFTQIVSIKALNGYGESLHLMAVTSFGIRYYLDANLKLLHVRLPPSSVSFRESTGFSPQKDHKDGLYEATLQSGEVASRVNFKMGNVKLVAHNRGSVVFVCESEEMNADADSCCILCVSPDPFPWSTALSEQATCMISDQIELPRSVWVLSDLTEEELYQQATLEALEESKTPDQNRFYSESTCKPAPKKFTAAPPVVMTQHVDPAVRRFLLVSADGLYHLTLASPMHHLKKHLASHLTPDASSIGLFSTSPTRNKVSFLANYLHQFGPDESISAALCIASQARVVKNFPLQRLAEQTVTFFAMESCNLWNPMASG
ncbi:hypothetical protein Ciccas_007327 [Cichlidogyrus casuarinus]|uniref:Nucleoporin Nup133/Nup155-like N-terminal domain-containing protein n=1 Tax=Cichlidogyrus casuarinus TaxID=1844966 RepID=A0ABD2Q3X7_9PLAT